MLISPSASHTLQNIPSRAIITYAFSIVTKTTRAYFNLQSCFLADPTLSNWIYYFFIIRSSAKFALVPDNPRRKRRVNLQLLYKFLRSPMLNVRTSVRNNADVVLKNRPRGANSHITHIGCLLRLSMEERSVYLNVLQDILPTSKMTFPSPLQIASFYQVTNYLLRDGTINRLYGRIYFAQWNYKTTNSYHGSPPPVLATSFDCLVDLL